MEQQARVTPKNIQFVENIHVREIPSNEIQLLETSREESWDPNFNEVISCHFTSKVICRFDLS